MALLRSSCFLKTLPFQSPASSVHRPSSISLSVSSISLSSFSISIATHFSKPLKLQSLRCQCIPSATLETGSVEEVKVSEAGEKVAGPRSRLIAQNVPWSATADDIRALFEKFGSVVDVEVSMHSKTRNRGLAFVTMGSPEEALAALKGLEAFEFEGRTLKINYAKSLKKKPPAPRDVKLVSPYNLFIANLSFEARSKDIREFFSSEGAKVVSAEVIFNENPRKSSGYGFVSFNSKEAAETALKAFDGKIFMDRPIRVARSKRFAKQGTNAKTELVNPTSLDAET